MSNIFTALVRKEALHIVRDSRTMLVTLFIPVVLLLLFGFAISMEVNHIKVTAVVERHTQETREAVERLQVNPYINFKGMARPQEMERQLRSGKADAIVVLRDDRGAMNTQIIVDASNTATAQSVSAYLQNIVAGQTATPFVTHTLYNPQLKSAYNFVPGVMGMLFILICGMLTSVAIVREKENGTMNLLLVSPIRPWVVVLGKLTTYFLLSCIILAMILTVCYTLLDIPFSASALNVIWFTLLYITLALSIGLLISTMVNTQLSALMVSAVAFMMPIMLLSGMIFPIDNMPWPLQWLSVVVPARWYVEATRVLMIEQLPLQYVMKELWILTGMTLLILIIAIKRFSSQR